MRRAARSTASQRRSRPSAPPRILLGPGPSNVHPRVLRALATPLVGHLDPAFIELMEETKRLLRATLPHRERADPADLGHRLGRHGGLPGQPARAGRHGHRRRQRRVRHAHGRHRRSAAARRPVAVEAPWGRIIEPDAVAEALRSASAAPSWSRVVHAETSTGAWQPLEEIGRLVRDAGALFVVDTVTSLGGCPVRSRRLADRRLLQRHAEVPELSARAGAAHLRAARRRRRCTRRRTQGAELVPRPDDDREVLGRRARLPPHRADLDELRAARSAAPGRTRKGWRRAGRATSATTRR